MNGDTVKVVAVCAALGAAIYAVYKGVGGIAAAGRKTAQAVGSAVNPLSDKNLAYRAASNVTSALTGSNNSFGGWLADKFNPAAQNVALLFGNGMTGSVPPQTAQKAMASAPVIDTSTPLVFTNIDTASPQGFNSPDFYTQPQQDNSSPVNFSSPDVYQVTYGQPVDIAAVLAQDTGP